MTKAACREKPGAFSLMCLGCCPPSERHWFKWVLLAQPVVAAILLVLVHFGLVS